MTNTGLSELGMRLLDRLTDAWPSAVPKLAQRLMLGILGREQLYRWYLRRYRKQWRAVGDHPQKLLLIVDVNIGDAVLAAQCLPRLQAIFPEVELHLACNQLGGELLEAMPGITVHNIFRGGVQGMPSPEDLTRLRAVLLRESFSAVLNMCPFISKRNLRRNAAHAIQLYVPFSAYVFRAWKLDAERHVSYLARTFLIEFFQDYGDGDRQARLGLRSDSTPDLNTNAVYLGAAVIEGAREFLHAHDLSPGSGLLFFHPDATSKFGLIPFDVQSRLLRHALENEEIAGVLLGKPFTYTGLDQRLVESIPPPLRKRLVVIPHVPLGVYVALMDACDMFLAGDTGPIHIASCRKVASDGNALLRNQTAVLAIYGATDSRMYGYDSTVAHHAPANQDVPSISFSAPAPCRNITCINKYGKFCQKVRCFDGLPVPSIEANMDAHFRRLKLERPISITLAPERAFYL